MYIIIDLSKFYGGLKPKAKRVVVLEMASQKTKISSLFIFFPPESPPPKWVLTAIFKLQHIRL